MPAGLRTFSVDLDFLDHTLSIRANDGSTRTMPLRPRTVADFYAAYMEHLHALQIYPRIRPVPVEVVTAVPFPRDREHAAYDPDAATRCWRILQQGDRVLKRFRGRFLSCGFWPGSPAIPEPAFYAYTYPAPAGYQERPIRPAAAYYHHGIGEFILPYEAVRSAASPDDALLEFMQSTYEAAADTSRWDRAALDRPPAEWP